MKLLLLIFFPFFSIAQDSTYEPGDSTWLTSSDTGKVKVYKEKYQTAIIRIDGKDELVYGGLLSNVILQKGIDSLIAQGKTIHYTNKGNKEYDELSGGEGWKKMAAKFTKVIERKDVVYDVYPDPVSIYLNHTDELPLRPKYDTIGPFWKQVSDTTAGYNPVMAMQLYEVTELVNDWVKSRPKKNPVKIVKDKNGEEFRLYESTFYIEKHFAWLDLKKKPFKFKVW